MDAVSYVEIVSLEDLGEGICLSPPLEVRIEHGSHEVIAAWECIFQAGTTKDEAVANLKQELLVFRDEVKNVSDMELAPGLLTIKTRLLESIGH